MLPVSAFAAFSDVSSTTNYRTAIEALQAKGVLEGYANGTYGPHQSINRAEFLKIVLGGAGINATGTKGNCFPDVTDEWFASIVCKAEELKIVAGFPDGKFYPEKNVTFVEASKIMSLAYRQQVSNSYVEWYEPYANALEASKVIPPTINTLDKAITRAEMAEMMWRISEKKTDQPAIGVRNIQHPDAKINFASDAVQVATSCADIKAFTQTQQGDNGMMYRNELQGGVAEGAVPPMAPSVTKNANAVSDQATSGSDGDYSKTNVQVEGVDEGDIVKTDGTYVYVAHGSKISIVLATPGNAMKEVSSLDHQKQNFTPSELYINGNKMIVVGNSWNNYAQPMLRSNGFADAKIAIWPPYYNSGRTEIRIYDVTDKANPKSERTVSFEGNKISTRMIADNIYLVMNQNLPYWNGPIPLSNVKEDDALLPKFKDSAKGSADLTLARCADVSILPHVPSPQYLIVAVVPTNDLKKDVQKDVILGNAENVYASLKNLYVASTQWNYDWDSARSASREQTNVFKFALNDSGVTFAKQGAVPGHILNQFSMDEHENTFRIATTSGNAWDASSTSQNNVYVLNSDMQTVGKLEKLAPGEQIYSVRFMGDRAYVVTFKTVDPLFVIDTSDARNPKVLGKLKIPGYSNYLHPYDETHLIGFGKDVDETIDADKVHTDNAIYYTAVKGMKLGLFDVSDVANPKEIANEVIGDRGTESPLLYDHHALLFDKERGLLAFPVTLMEYSAAEKLKKPSEAIATQTFQGAYIYDVNLRDGFKLRGRITQYTPEDITKMGQYFYGKQIERLIQLKDQLISVSQAEVASHSLDKLQFQGRVSFPQPDQQVYPMMDGMMR